MNLFTSAQCWIKRSVIIVTPSMQVIGFCCIRLTIHVCLAGPAHVLLHLKRVVEAFHCWSGCLPCSSSIGASLAALIQNSNLLGGLLEPRTADHAVQLSDL